MVATRTRPRSRVAVRLVIGWLASTLAFPPPLFADQLKVQQAKDSQKLLSELRQAGLEESGGSADQGHWGRTLADYQGPSWQQAPPSSLLRREPTLGKAPSAGEVDLHAQDVLTALSDLAESAAGQAVERRREYAHRVEEVIEQSARLDFPSGPMTLTLRDVVSGVRMDERGLSTQEWEGVATVQVILGGKPLGAGTFTWSFDSKRPLYEAWGMTADLHLTESDLETINAHHVSVDLVRLTLILTLAYYARLQGFPRIETDRHKPFYNTLLGIQVKPTFGGGGFRPLVGYLLGDPTAGEHPVSSRIEEAIRDAWGQAWIAAVEAWRTLLKARWAQFLAAAAAELGAHDRVTFSTDGATWQVAKGRRGDGVVFHLLVREPGSLREAWWIEQQRMDDFQDWLRVRLEWVAKEAHAEPAIVSFSERLIPVVTWLVLDEAREVENPHFVSLPPDDQLPLQALLAAVAAERENGQAVYPVEGVLAHMVSALARTGATPPTVIPHRMVPGTKIAKL